MLVRMQISVALPRASITVGGRLDLKGAKIEYGNVVASRQTHCAVGLMQASILEFTHQSVGFGGAVLTRDKYVTRRHTRNLPKYIRARFARPIIRTLYARTRDPSWGKRLARATPRTKTLMKLQRKRRACMAAMKMDVTRPFPTRFSHQKLLTKW